MKTYKLEREAWKQLPATGEFVATRDVTRLIDDVEEATRLLARTQCHSFNPAPLKLRCEKADCETCDFLKEPSG